MPSVDIAALSVAEYAARIGAALREVGGATVEGEVQKPQRTDRGMLFFDVTDGDARLSCKVFPRDVRRLQHQPRHGDLVQVTIDRPDFYAQQGRVSVIVSALRLAGEGELLRRREELLRRLTGDGLCDPAAWKPLPPFPRAVGVIAGRGSDGLSDVVRALCDRWPPVHVVTCAARVQGVEAPGELVDALARMQQHPLVDVVIVARGGGSVQDLVAFDAERVCRAIHACAKPVVCAVGHTDNVPVCNHVTHHAPTPSRAPELVVPDAAALRAQLRLAGASLADVAPRAERWRERVEALGARVDTRRVLDAELVRLAGAAQALASAPHLLDERNHALARARTLLSAVPARMPTREALAGIAARIDARAHTFFGERTLALRATADRLAAGPSGIAARADTVAAEGRRVTVGTRRQLADHERDYGHALARIAREAAASAHRSLTRHDDALSRIAPLVTERARRRLADAERALRHVADVVGTADLRARGWVLASDLDGGRLTAARTLSRGTRLRLHFRDGEVAATVDSAAASPRGARRRARRAAAREDNR